MSDNFILQVSRIVTIGKMTPEDITGLNKNFKTEDLRSLKLAAIKILNDKQYIASENDLQKVETKISNYDYENGYVDKVEKSYHSKCDVAARNAFNADKSIDHSLDVNNVIAILNSSREYLVQLNVQGRNKAEGSNPKELTPKKSSQAVGKHEAQLI